MLYQNKTMSLDTLAFLHPVSNNPVARRTASQLTGFCCSGYHPLDSAIYSTQLSCSQLNLFSTQLVLTIQHSEWFDNHSNLTNWKVQPNQAVETVHRLDTHG